MTRTIHFANLVGVIFDEDMNVLKHEFTVADVDTSSKKALIRRAKKETGFDFDTVKCVSEYDELWECSTAEFLSVAHKVEK